MLISDLSIQYGCCLHLLILKYVVYWHIQIPIEQDASVMPLKWYLVLPEELQVPVAEGWIERKRLFILASTEELTRIFDVDVNWKQNLSDGITLYGSSIYQFNSKHETIDFFIDATNYQSWRPWLLTFISWLTGVFSTALWINQSSLVTRLW